jgi:hypothetical protein
MTDPATKSSGDGRAVISPPALVSALSVIDTRRMPAPLPPAAARAAFLMTIERLEQVIDLETRELGGFKVADLREFNHRKSQALLELSRVMRGLGDSGLGERGQAKLVRLRAKLDKNLSVLRMHLTAAQEVSAIIARAIQEADSDGTYSAAHAAKGQEPC